MKVLYYLMSTIGNSIIRYYCNEIISNDGDIRKSYPLFRPQNDPKIPAVIVKKREGSFWA